MIIMAKDSTTCTITLGSNANTYYNFQQLLTAYTHIQQMQIYTTHNCRQTQMFNIIYLT